MNRTTIVLAGAALIVALPATAEARTPRPRPVPAVSITGAEVCGAGGYITVSGTLTATVPGTFDVVFTGDLASYQAEQYVGTFT
jgi:hypothetical protein